MLRHIFSIGSQIQQLILVLVRSLSFVKPKTGTYTNIKPCLQQAMDQQPPIPPRQIPVSLGVRATRKGYIFQFAFIVEVSSRQVVGVPFY